MLSFGRLIVYLCFTALLIPVQAIAIKLGSPLQLSIPLFYHRNVCRLFGFRIDVHGKISTARPTLFVSNHVSYLDIELLGSLLPASFVAKAEVAAWPLFGLLAKLQRTVFVDRRRGTAAKQRDNMRDRLDAGGSIILFPEGTSGDGTHVRPFKSALFSAAEIRVGGAAIQVQPVTIAYLRRNDLPIGRTGRPQYAWYGDMELMAHMWAVLQQPSMTVCIQFHKPVTIDEFGTRKRLSDYCQGVIGEALASANSGRLPAPVETNDKLSPSPSDLTLQNPQLSAEPAH